MRNLMFPCLSALLVISTVPVHAQPKMKIGVSVPLTGEAANSGLDLRDQIMFAAEDLAAGRYDLVIEDDKCSGKDAVTVAHKLVEIDKVRAVLGFGCSGAVLASAPVYDRAGVLLMDLSGSAPAISQAGEWVFRTVLSDAAVGPVLYRHIAAKHKSIGIISEETDYAQGIKATFVDAAGGGGLKISTEDFQSGTVDFRTVLAKLKASGAEALFINSQTEPAFAAVLRQFKQMGWPVQVYGAYWPASPAFLKLAGAEAEGIEYVNYPALEEMLNPAGRAAYARYLARYGQVRGLDVLFAFAYEGFRAMHLALQSGADPRSYLYTTGFDGIFGPYRFDRNGDIQGLSLVIGRIEGGKPVSLPGSRSLSALQ